MKFLRLILMLLSWIFYIGDAPENLLSACKSHSCLFCTSFPSIPLHSGNNKARKGSVVVLILTLQSPTSFCQERKESKKGEQYSLKAYLHGYLAKDILATDSNPPSPHKNHCLCDKGPSQTFYVLLAHRIIERFELERTLRSSRNKH